VSETLRIAIENLRGVIMDWENSQGRPDVNAHQSLAIVEAAATAAKVPAPRIAPPTPEVIDAAMVEAAMRYMHPGWFTDCGLYSVRDDPMRGGTAYWQEFRHVEATLAAALAGRATAPAVNAANPPAPRPPTPEGIDDREALVAHMKKHVSEGGSGGLIGCWDAADAILAAGFRRVAAAGDEGERT
jgi:hypothetical protein